MGGPESSWSDQQRRCAVHKQSESHGIKATMLGAHRPEHDEGRMAAGAVVASGATAAIAFDDALAQGILAGLAERGIAVPRDLSIIGCDDILAVKTYPSLTTVHGRSAEAGRLAVEMLLELVEDREGRDGATGHDDSRHRLSLMSSLISRATTGPAARH